MLDFAKTIGKVTSLIVALLMATIAVGACGSAESAVQSSSPSAAAPTNGGVLRVASASLSTMDPATTSTAAGIMVSHNVFEGLVEADAKLKVRPLLAASWESSSDGTQWTLHLQKGVVFHNGDPFDSGDVVSTFKRLRDPKVGSPVASTFTYIESIQTPDANTVVFTLKSPNPEFMKDLCDYHVVMMSESVSDPGKDLVGTGPFVFKSLSAQSRVVLARNAHYWMKDASGHQLPYLDGVEIIMTPDTTGQVEALRGGQMDLVYQVSPALATTLESDPSVRLVKYVSNNFYVLHMRTDRGPSQDVRVRRAIFLGMDHQGLLQAGSLGYGVPGNGTPVGPLYGDYSLDQTAQPDPAAARKLLEDAGYGSGFDMKLTVMNWGPIPAAATAFKEQMKAIGVRVDIQLVPLDVYYADKGPNSWLECDYGITDWLTRAAPVAYFNLSLTSDCAWNSAHFKNAEFDTLVAKISSEMDYQTRVNLYHQAQELLINEAPESVLYFDQGLVGLSAKVQGFDMAQPDLATSFRGIYMSQ